MLSSHCAGAKSQWNGEVLLSDVNSTQATETVQARLTRTTAPSGLAIAGCIHEREHNRALADGQATFATDLTNSESSDDGNDARGGGYSFKVNDKIPPHSSRVLPQSLLGTTNTHYQ